MAKKKVSKKKVGLDKIGWNEFNTFSKVIYPYLQDELGYPERRSKYFDEQTWVQKRGDQKGPYDGAFKNQTGVIVLVEAKKEERKLSQRDIKQLFDYCLGNSFPVPPPYALLSNGNDHKWYKRLKNRAGEFSYAPCDPVNWKKALKQKGAGQLTEQLTLNQIIKLLKKVREEIFYDLTDQYFPTEYKFSVSKLGSKKSGFEKILDTRKTFVDPTLEKAKEATAIRSVLSSIALSLTLKVLFAKIITDRGNEPFPEKLKTFIKKNSIFFPGILKAEPYDILNFSSKCEELIVGIMSSVAITQALVFEDSHNPIGDIWDGLVESEELDLQVKSLGNVYTPPNIVNAMIDKAGTSNSYWKNITVLEPACGSGHFVREIYRRIRDANIGVKGTAQKVIESHKKAINNLKAMDIDPFAIQTTQLGMFLELFRLPELWKSISNKDGSFDFKVVVEQGDYLESALFEKFPGFEPGLVIGNPPYGISVSKQVAEQFNVGSNDSYGCFLAKGLNSLSPGGRLIFIVSSTFLTAKTHRELREQIFEKSFIDSVYVLHRNSFPGRDVFCCITDFVVKREEDDRANSYKFYDAWPVHPNEDLFMQSLNTWIQDETPEYEKELVGYYRFPQDLLRIRKMPPTAKVVEKSYAQDRENTGSGVDIDINEANDYVYPIISGLPSLFLFCSDIEYQNRVRFNSVRLLDSELNGVSVRRDNKEVNILKLWQIAQVRQGLATADDNRFLRKTPGVIPNARRRNMKDVDLRCTIPSEDLSDLTDDQKENGIEVVDHTRERYFVPLDKGGEQNTAEGELRTFYSDVDYWIDWSREAVDLLKERDAWPAGTPKKPRFQNRKYYFRQGIRYARAGLYSPTFELSFGGVFGDKGSLIIPFDDRITKYLLGILCSPLIRYISKSFLQHTVMTEIDIIRQIPIAICNDDDFQALVEEVENVIEEKRNGNYAEEEMQRCWEIVYRIYDIPSEDIEEINTWFKRRYPHFGNAKE